MIKKLLAFMGNLWLCLGSILMCVSCDVFLGVYIRCHCKKIKYITFCQQTNYWMKHCLLFGKSMLICWIHIDGCVMYCFLVLSSRNHWDRGTYFTFSQKMDYWTWITWKNVFLNAWSILMCVLCDVFWVFTSHIIAIR